jgi:hypothetical protein
VQHLHHVGVRQDVGERRFVLRVVSKSDAHPAAPAAATIAIVIPSRLKRCSARRKRGDYPLLCALRNVTWESPVLENLTIMVTSARRIGLIVFSGAMLILGGGCKSDNLKTMTVDEVATRIAAKDGHTFVFDDNPHERFAKGHLPGATWLDKEPTQADLPSDKGALLVFYCASEL